MPHSWTHLWPANPTSGTVTALIFVKASRSDRCRRGWKPMAKDNDQQTTEGSNSLGYSLILALWRLSGTSATATIDLIPLGLPIMASFWTTLWLLVWMTCNYYVHTSFNLLHATVNTNKPGTEHFNLGPHLLTTGARQQEAKLWEENDAWPWIWIYLKLVETNISSEERAAPRLLPWFMCSLQVRWVDTNRPWFVSKDFGSFAPRCWVCRSYSGMQFCSCLEFRL